MKKISLLMSCALVIVLTGCGGAKVLKKPEPLKTTQRLTVASDPRLATTLDWVIVRAGPGTWAKNADWDEYLLRFKNLTDSPMQITNVWVYDSLGIQTNRQLDRRALVKGTKGTKRRYRDSDIKVKAGMGTGKMLAAGAAVGVVGYGLALGAAAPSFGAGAAAGGGVGAAGAVLLAAPVIAFLGIKKGVNNSKVNSEIIRRQTVLPLALPSSDEVSAKLFFPLSPSPTHVEVIYTDTEGEYRLVIDTQEALNGLHLVPEKK